MFDLLLQLEITRQSVEQLYYLWQTETSTNS